MIRTLELPHKNLSTQQCVLIEGIVCDAIVSVFYSRLRLALSQHNLVIDSITKHNYLPCLALREATGCLSVANG